MYVRSAQIADASAPSFNSILYKDRQKRQQDPQGTGRSEGLLGTELSTRPETQT